MTNTLFYGDNLGILRDHVADESIDLIYLDPPFNSNRTYNVLFKEKSGDASPAQIEAFNDTWQWDRSAEKTYDELVIDGPHNVSQMISAMRQFLGSNDMMAYLVMMAARLIELHRVLKPTGSLYLHCDPTASHYLKILLDSVFGPRQFRNEIVWQRTSAHSDAHRWGPNNDAILFCSKSDAFNWNPQYQGHSESLRASHYANLDESGRRYTLSDLTAQGTRQGRSGMPWRGFDPATKGNHWKYTIERLDELETDGRIYWPSKPGGWPRYIRYLDELKGVPLQAIWTDVPPVNAKALERLGYPTQKPLALLERIISGSSNPGDIVLDPFCGCGTAVIAAQKLGRQWIGIDVTHLAISLIKYRLEDSFPGIEFDVRGEPADVGAALMLAEADRYQFQWWALSLVKAKPVEGKEKKGADKGIDGVIVFVDDVSRMAKRCLVQVKSGGVNRATVGELVGTVSREKAELGLLVTLELSTGPMRQEAVETGFYDSPGWGRTYPKIQIITIAELLAGKRPDLPPARQTFQQAPVIGENIQQPALGLVD